MSPPTPASVATASATATPATGYRPRLDSIDLLRGLVIVLMALDHTRDFFSNVLFDPLDLTRTNAALFLTRWITHYCAPTFIFLAGTSAFLSRNRGKSAAQLSQFLLSRGLVLVFLELVWVRCFGWYFNFDFSFTVGAVIWAIGWSMVVLAALVYLPPRYVGLFGIVLIVGHNLLDPIDAKPLGAFQWLWAFLHHSEALTPYPGYQFIVAYPLVPWVGVMAAGYWFGTIMLQPAAQRRKRLLVLGSSLIAGFVLVRGLNVYGDPKPWTPQANWLLTAFSFIDCFKYPPSLAYLLMTLGPSILVLGLLRDQVQGPFRALVTFGRVPLFFYLLHLPLIHGLAVIVAYARFGHAEWLFANPGPPGTSLAPPGNGFGLPIVYLAWLSVVVLLYWPCHWFAALKQRSRNPLLSYL